jgi:neopullulanase
MDRQLVCSYKPVHWIEEGLSMNRRKLFTLLASGCFTLCLAQSPRVLKVEPPNWWVGMRTNTIQLMVYGENLQEMKVQSASSSLKVLRTHTVANPSYTFVDLEIPPIAPPGSYELLATSKAGTTAFHFPILARTPSDSVHQGFDPSDVIYLVVPDRFANGDTTNDTVSGMIEPARPDHPVGRHGGDIRGIMARLDYLRDLGVTALWLTPLVENNMNTGSYHGYGATDLYAIDPRFGTNALYASLVRQAHARGLKIIMDHVNNHIGINHPWIKNLPAPDWLNGSVELHQKPFHSKVELDDPHSDSLTRQRATRCWFDNRLADNNQSNPFLARYLTQNTLWWIEFSGIDGIREDTYPYIDPAFREGWCKAILEEYPRFNIVGEVWVQDPAFLAPYQRGSLFRRTVAPQLPSITDFGLYDALVKCFADSAGSIETVFTTLSKDFLYADPFNLVTFLDNHDIRRFMFATNGDVKRFTLALFTLLTTRGIPQLLYGTEIGMKGGSDHGTLRADFPGGFGGNSRNAFNENGRTEQEQDIYRYTRQLLNIRKSLPALQRGRLTHFRPNHEVYVYFRTLDGQQIMVVVNRNAGRQMVRLAPFMHQMRGVVRLRSVMTGDTVVTGETSEIPIEGMTGDLFQVIRSPE